MRACVIRAVRPESCAVEPDVPQTEPNCFRSFFATIMIPRLHAGCLSDPAAAAANGLDDFA
jgi:hypothetical protein